MGQGQVSPKKTGCSVAGMPGVSPARPATAGRYSDCHRGLALNVVNEARFLRKNHGLMLLQSAMISQFLSGLAA